jgi:5-methylcytosine-specific restriction endonuclease McrA
MITLGIDWGASNVGVALVRNSESENEPLFAGTIIIDPRMIKEKVEARANIRGLRRSRKTKKRRLRELRLRLLGLGSDPATISRIINFCERRGYSHQDKDDKETQEESQYKVHRNKFFQNLEEELERIFPPQELRGQVLRICEQVLNSKGDPRQEPRPARFDNRGVSRCAWEGCNNVTPRHSNATDDAIAQQLVTYFQGVLKETPSSKEKVIQVAVQLNMLAKELRAAIEDEAEELKKGLRKRARESLEKLKDDLTDSQPVTDETKRAWKYVKDGMMSLLENTGGRNSYCREHSKAYIETVLSGKQPPFKQTISESDIISRREQITFGKFWRYIEARILPLAPEGIDRIVVERTAFDMLAGSRKVINKTSDKRIEDIYQQGPMYDCLNRKDMLQKEFGGLCAYCGKPSNTLIECEHILPRSQFFFDSYLNILPSCPSCNAEKGSRLPGKTSLHISKEAYAKYDEYLNNLKTKRPLHFLHTEKKGILNLMKEPERAWEVEQYLGLIANNFAAITQSQRGPRPLARLLYSKLSPRQDKPPDICFRSGRHTSLYRTIAYPRFQKTEDKSDGGTVNHALDAILLACQLPDPTPLEARGVNIHTVGTWRRKVLSQAPKAGKEGIPTIPNYPWYVEGFETVDPGGYVAVEMATMNWNQKDSAKHKQDPYGWSDKAEKPTKRKSALALYDEIVKEKDKKKVERIIQTIYHPTLRDTMLAVLDQDPVGPTIAEVMKKWLQQSVRKSINKSTFSNHPADQARKLQLENFVNNNDSPVPKIMGIKCLDTGVQGKIDLERLDPITGKTGHRYMADPANQSMILAYPRLENGKADFAKPYTAGVRQNFALKTENTKFLPKPPELENGLIWGSKAPSNHLWRKKLETYLSDCGFHSYAMLTPCCVIRYKDGKEKFIRNFDKSKDFKKRILTNVIGVRRTPFSDRFTPLKQLTPNRVKA